MHDLDAIAVALRLAELRRSYVAESVEEGRTRLAIERPPRRESFAEAVAARLRELRALCELARYLHRADSNARPAVTDGASRAADR